MRLKQTNKIQEGHPDTHIPFTRRVKNEKSFVLFEQEAIKAGLWFKSWTHLDLNADPAIFALVNYVFLHNFRRMSSVTATRLTFVICRPVEDIMVNKLCSYTLILTRYNMH